MPSTYADYVATMATMTAIDATQPEFTTVLPTAIAYAENRIYRELDMLAEDVRDASGTTTANLRNFTVPTTIGTFQVINQVNIITPAGVSPEEGTRNPCVPVSLPVLDVTWPGSTGSGLPNQWAYISQANQTTQPNWASQTNIVFGPWPNDSYVVEVVGKVIPTPLSATRTTTFLTLYYWDLFVAASMVWFTGYLKNFGAQSDDPRSALSWEQTYQSLKASADVWEARKRFAGASWTSKQLEPSAQPQRG